MQPGHDFEGESWIARRAASTAFQVQSLDEVLLDRLGEPQPEAVFKSFDVLRSAGFDNINVDPCSRFPPEPGDMASNFDLKQSLSRASTFLLRGHLRR